MESGYKKNDEETNIEEHIKNGKFFDPKFRTEEKSIFGEMKEKEFKEYKTKKLGIGPNGKITWVRIFDPDIDIPFEEKEDNLNVTQGALGNCYFIAFIHSLKENYPDIFYSIIKECDSKKGYFEVYFYFERNGQLSKESIFVDDFIPYKKLPKYFVSLYRPLFSSYTKFTKEINELKYRKYSIGKYLLIEKAYAKVAGSYLKIRGKSTSYDIHLLLTGVKQRIEYLTDILINQTKKKGITKYEAKMEEIRKKKSKKEENNSKEKIDWISMKKIKNEIINEKALDNKDKEEVFKKINDISKKNLMSFGTEIKTEINQDVNVNEHGISYDHRYDFIEFKKIKENFFFYLWNPYGRNPDIIKNKYKEFEEIYKINEKGIFNGDIILNFDEFFLSFKRIIYIDRDQLIKTYEKYRTKGIYELLGITPYQRILLLLFGNRIDIIITLLLIRINQKKNIDIKESLNEFIKEIDDSKGLNHSQMLWFLYLWNNIKNEIIKLSKEIMNKKINSNLNITNVDEIKQKLIEENNKYNETLIKLSEKKNSNILNEKLIEINKEIESIAKLIAEEHYKKNQEEDNIDNYSKKKILNFSNINNDKWIKLPGQLKQLCISNLGLYGVNKYDEIFYREGIDFSNKEGNSWIKLDGQLKHISCCKYDIWGVNCKDEIFYRNNVTEDNPLGNGWTKVDGLLKMISVSDYGVFGVNSNDEIWYREGISYFNKTGTHWTKIDGLLKYLSIGYYGFWGVNSNDEIWYRNDVSLSNPKGNGWTKIDGLLKMVSVSDYGVWGVNSNDEIWYRKGLSEYNHKGTEWVKIEGLLKHISVGYYGLYGVNMHDEIFTKDNQL